MCSQDAKFEHELKKVIQDTIAYFYIKPKKRDESSESSKDGSPIKLQQQLSSSSPQKTVKSVDFEIGGDKKHAKKELQLASLNQQVETQRIVFGVSEFDETLEKIEFARDAIDKAK